MKNAIRLIFALLSPMFLAPLAKAESHVVASLTTSSAQTIIQTSTVAGKQTQFISICNATGGAQVNITVDGGAANGGTDPATGATGVAAFWIAAGQTLVLYGPTFQGVAIRAIMATGTTTLTIGTGAPVGSSSFPIN